MKSGRLEAFSDGVFAIIITIMVLELKAPEGTSIESILPLLPIFLSYLISFIYLGTYWYQHHHLFLRTKTVTHKILFTNLHLLFWLSLIPFATSWVDENHIDSLPVAFYGFILLMSAIVFVLLQKLIIHKQSEESSSQISLDKGIKGRIPIILYVLGIALSFLHPWIGILCYVLALILWYIPNRKVQIESFEEVNS